VSGATKDELALPKDAAIDAGIATQFSPTKATVGLKELAQAGFNAQDSMKLLIPVLDLAGGSIGAQLGPGCRARVAGAQAFGQSADDAGMAVDPMLQAVYVFALNASELPLALGISSCGAQALHQSMSETLISLGLVKNIIPTVERASTGLAVAMERLADPKTQTALKGIGVAVTDNKGQFRSFLDVLGDMAPELDKMTDAKRSAFLIDTFGAHALGSVQAILTQVTNGIKTNTGVTLKGSDAIAYLRQQFENAGGTAAAFRDKMLDTFIALFVAIISSAVSIVSGVIGAVMAVFSALADVVAGVVFIIGGIFSGSWTDIWTGMKLIAFGVIDAVIGAVLELAGAIGGVIDSIAGMFGASTGIQSAVRDFKGYTHREMAKDFGVESLSFTPVKPTTS